MGGKRSVVINGHRTSIFVEDEFWNELKSIALIKQLSTRQLIEQIDERKGEIPNLSSAVRIYVLEQVRGRVGSAKEYQGKAIDRLEELANERR